ncbi:MAG: ribonuclease Y [Planctomycetes bacterium]|nr:ribonuclease Y [Planctomycetota bacterium]
MGVAEVIWALAGVLAGAALVFLVYRAVQVRGENTARQTLERARGEAEKIAREADAQVKTEVVRKREDAEREIAELRRDLKVQEKRISKREDNLERKLDLLNKKERYVESKERAVGKRETKVETLEAELEKLVDEEKQNLLRITELSREEAEKLVLARVEQDLELEKETLIARMVERTKEEGETRAKEILVACIQRLASSASQSSTVSNVEIPDDAMKGRVIGREGRNIRAFEKATGVNVIVDDTPGVITVSCFDSIRREMARRAMEKLIADGRIHPTRIEEIVEATKKEMNAEIQREGKQACYDLNVAGLHPRLVTLLGRLRFRSSYGQNVLEHSKECAQLAGMIAGELGLDVKLARRCALLHDIGKAVDHEVEGGHPDIGANLAKRYDERPEVVNAIASHHNDVPQETLYAVISQAADAISGARPGARGETLERYIKRLEKLEAVATSFSGVKAANAIQAGREVRIFVNAQKVSDKKAVKLCRDIAREIEQQLTYPGEIKVTLLREMRVVEYAR